ncbi:MAG: hypothetical protein FWG64_05335 [Firmicutes bacterium]|nr:hypothetical protein [Bacillota bacterium]
MNINLFIQDNVQTNTPNPFAQRIRTQNSDNALVNRFNNIIANQAEEEEKNPVELDPELRVSISREARDAFAKIILDEHRQKLEGWIANRNRFWNDAQEAFPVLDSTREIFERENFPMSNFDRLQTAFNPSRNPFQHPSFGNLIKEYENIVDEMKSSFANEPDKLEEILNRLSEDFDRITTDFANSKANSIMGFASMLGLPSFFDSFYGDFYDQFAHLYLELLGPELFDDIMSLFGGPTGVSILDLLRNPGQHANDSREFLLELGQVAKDFVNARKDMTAEERSQMSFADFASERMDISDPRLAEWVTGQTTFVTPPWENF